MVGEPGLPDASMDGLDTVGISFPAESADSE